jgi:hypothetical protein
MTLSSPAVPVERRRALLAALTTLLLLVSGLISLAASSGEAAAAVPGAPTGWTTVFSDDFNGPAGSGLPSHCPWAATSPTPSGTSQPSNT